MGMKPGRTITLLERSLSPYGGFTPEAAATIFRVDSGKWGYCIHGINDAGLYWEMDDVVDFASAKAAEMAAKDWWLRLHPDSNILGEQEGKG